MRTNEANQASVARPRKRYDPTVRVEAPGPEAGEQHVHTLHYADEQGRPHHYRVSAGFSALTEQGGVMIEIKVMRKDVVTGRGIVRLPDPVLRQLKP